MAFTFSCPSCRAELLLPDEAAGQSGQCPRCQAVMRIPSSMQPRAVVVQPGTAIPVETPPAAKPPPVAKPPVVERPQPRSRRPRQPLPEGSVAPTWPTLVGIFGALIVAGLLFASVVVLFAVREPNFLRP